VDSLSNKKAKRFNKNVKHNSYIPPSKSYLIPKVVTPPELK